jgi:hypothetical protein
MDDASYLTRFWRDAKTWRSIRLGPVTLHLRLGRSHPRSRVAAVWPHAVAPALRPMPANGDLAVIAGMGAEIGPALVRKLSREGMRVAVISRSSLQFSGPDAPRSFACDVTDQRAVSRTFRRDYG